jgi:hypothetical protein
MQGCRIILKLFLKESRARVCVYGKQETGEREREILNYNYHLRGNSVNT